MDQAVTNLPPTSPKILIIDSNLERGTFLREHLISWGYDAAYARDGYTAMRRIMEERPALILVDAELKGWPSSMVIDSATRLGSRAMILMLNEPDQNPVSRASHRRIVGIVRDTDSIGELRVLVTTALDRSARDHAKPPEGP